MSTHHHRNRESDDEDDDLRSLLSGNTTAADLRNPHTQRIQQQQQQQQQKQQQQLEEEERSTHNQSPVTISLSSAQSEDNSNTMRVGSLNNSHNTNACASSKKALWILGTIILAMGLLGPSGILWDLFEDGDDPSDYSSIPAGADHSRHVADAHHGDKHHHISPAKSMVDDRDGMENAHPMMRASAQYAAPGSRKHGQFGSTKRVKKDKKKKGKKGGDAGGGGGWGIKEAIDNIDKVFLDNRPVAGSTTVVKKKKFVRGEDEDDAFPTDDAVVGEIPIVHADDDALPENAENMDAYTYSLPASDALECRASVVAFVINATDVRDECDGLRKAFDKTCSVSAPAPAVVNNVAGTNMQRSRRLDVQHGHRRLSERGKPHLWNLIPDAFEREVRKMGERMKSHLRRRLEEVHNRGTMHHGRLLIGRSNRTLYEAIGSGGKGLHGSVAVRKVEEVTSPEDVEAVQHQQQQHHHQQQKQQEQGSPLVSLNIPTSDKHISDSMLNDALLLQNNEQNTNAPPEQQLQQPLPTQQEAHLEEQSRDIPPLAPPAVASNPNITAASAEAVQDAAESAEAIRTAVEGVKNIMNDQKSIEARTCCASILSVFHEHCDPTTTGVEDYSDRRLLVVVFVITVCGIVKSLIRHLNIRWLPEAGGCILVGVFGYLVLEHMPHVQFAFDGDMFLRIMVPPIVFEAAVKINKQSFRRHIIPITIFSIFGTLASTAFTATLLHKCTSMTNLVSTIPVRESLIFGSLISSIDPIAVLSVLNNMGMSDTDTIYVLIFGESLLNDGVAIVLFQTLVHFLDESLVIDSDVVLDAFLHFIVVAFGSISVGVACGACATVYFSLMHGCQTPMVEVIMFCCWSFIPYYICDMVEWSGIVAIVANGFVMDLYVIGQKHHQHSSENVDDEIDFLVNGNGSNGTRPHQYQQQQCRSIFNYEGHLSSKADNHVHFVIEIFATLMETAIFAYLGLFLFSPRYHWSGYLTLISIFATVMGRVIMIPLFSHVANIFNRIGARRKNSAANLTLTNITEQGVHIDRQMQLVLVFAGLRGAMSFALVEHIPMFDTTTGQGSRFKPELKAMTSASVIFTVFVLGGATSYLMERMGYSTNKQQQHEAIEIAPLVGHEKRKSPMAKQRKGLFSASTVNDGNNGLRGMRQRGSGSR